MGTRHDGEIIAAPPLRVQAIRAQQMPIDFRKMPLSLVRPANFPGGVECDAEAEAAGDIGGIRVQRQMGNGNHAELAQNATNDAIHHGDRGENRAGRILAPDLDRVTAERADHRAEQERHVKAEQPGKSRPDERTQQRRAKAKAEAAQQEGPVIVRHELFLLGHNPLHFHRHTSRAAFAAGVGAAFAGRTVDDAERAEEIVALPAQPLAADFGMKFAPYFPRGWFHRFNFAGHGGDRARYRHRRR